MNYSKPRTYTIEKYMTYLKSMIIKINKEGDLFSASKFKDSNPIPQNFIHFCEELKYVSSQRIGKEKVFHSILKPEDVNKSHGLAIAEASLRYNINHSETYQESGNRMVTSKEKVDKAIVDIKTFSTDELLKELKRRGYSGEITKSIII